MKNIIILSTLMLGTISSQAAISLVAGSTAGPHMYLGNIGVGGSATNTVPAGPSANLYWDANLNDVFGETAQGENAGNDAGTLGFTINIASGTSYNFAYEGFGSPGTNQGADFDIHKTDTSVERIQVIDGNTTAFSDSNGDMWEVSYTFTEGGYGDVVTNIGSAPGGAANDHKAVLTFTQVPEPSSTALLGLGALGLLMRRRK